MSPIGPPSKQPVIFEPNEGYTKLVYDNLHQTGSTNKKMLLSLFSNENVESTCHLLAGKILFSILPKTIWLVEGKITTINEDHIDQFGFALRKATGNKIGFDFEEQGLLNEITIIYIFSATLHVLRTFFKKFRFCSNFLKHHHKFDLQTIIKKNFDINPHFSNEELIFLAKAISIFYRITEAVEVDDDDIYFKLLAIQKHIIIEHPVIVPFNDRLVSAIIRHRTYQARLPDFQALAYFGERRFSMHAAMGDMVFALNVVEKLKHYPLASLGIKKIREENPLISHKTALQMLCKFLATSPPFSSLAPPSLLRLATYYYKTWWYVRKKPVSLLHLAIDWIVVEQVGENPQLTKIEHIRAVRLQFEKRYPAYPFDSFHAESLIFKMMRQKILTCQKKPVS